MQSKVVVGVLALALGGGCTASEPTDAESAAQGWRAAAAAMQRGQQDFAADVQEGEDGSITSSCPDGGSVEVAGSSTGSALDLTVVFAACKAEGIVIDGTMSVTGSSTAQRAQFQYVGAIEMRGGVDLSCTIDVEGHTETSIDGTMVSAEAALSGSICGHDATVVAST